MDPDMTYRDLRHNPKIETLLNIIKPVGHSTHYAQQASISNLLVTVFAALQHLIPNPLRTNGHTARHLANTAP